MKQTALLVCNAGSTSLKFKLYEMPGEHVLARCAVDRVGDSVAGRFRYFGKKNVDTTAVTPDYETGILRFLRCLTDPETGVLADVGNIAAVGFKTVLSRGYYGVHMLDEAVLDGMREMMSVAPVHNRAYLAAIATVEKCLPGIPRIGVFETAFHQTMPPEAYLYAAPWEWYEAYGVRRLGYHGASHSHVADRLTRLLGTRYRAVSCHLGGSCSLCAVVDGRSVDTSFGLSLQTGLPQSNRSGDLDPFVLQYMAEKSGRGMEELFHELKTEGGLLGLSGVSGDLRDVEAAAGQGNERAALAIRVFCRELTRYIGGYAAMMGGLDAVAFTGGIGENSTAVREYVMEHLSFLGVKPSGHASQEGERELTEPDSAVRFFVIPADEELVVARKAWAELTRREAASEQV